MCLTKFTESQSLSCSKFLNIFAFKISFISSLWALV